MVMKGNVLVLGNSGVGKSTLINAVIGEEKAHTSFGITGTTNRLEIYGDKNPEIPFSLIDSVGFEPNPKKAKKAINLVKKWSKESTKAGNESSQINVVWFCIDGCGTKLFPETIENLARSISMWKNIPVIVVITKSYSKIDRQTNIEMVYNAFAMMTRYSCNLKAVMPVVAKIYSLDDTQYAEPEGISELIDKTLELMPEGIRIADNIISDFRIKRIRALTQSVVGAATAAAVTVGAVPIPFPDAALLVPIETTELLALAKIYSFDKEKGKDIFIKAAIDIGGVSAIGKTIITTLKAIPGIHLAAAILNAAVAGTIVAAIGETSIFIYDQIYTGKKSFNDMEWITNILKERLSPETLTPMLNSFINKLNNSDSNSKITTSIKETFNKKQDQ